MADLSLRVFAGSTSVDAPSEGANFVDMSVLTCFSVTVVAHDSLSRVP